MSKTILIVDDSPTEVHIMSRALENAGYNILTASEGTKARELARNRHPDLILLDVILPNASGFQICRELKSSSVTRDIKVLFITVKDQESDRYWGLRQGADGYLTKPLGETELLENIQKLM